MTIAEACGSWAAGLRYEDLTRQERKEIPLLLLNHFRAILIGAGTTWGRAARTVGLGLGAGSVSTVFAFGDSTDAGRAAFINGSLAHSADIDDTDVQGMVHAGAAVIPAVLALAEAIDVSGRELMVALFVGYEVTIRLARAVQPQHFARGFHATSTCGTIGAAAGAARILGLDGDGIASSIANGVSFASGIAQFYYTGGTIKRVHAGRAAEAGVVAALLSQAGVRGAPSAIEGRSGFSQAFADGKDLSSMLDRLGATESVIGDIVMKRHATSARLQGFIDAAFRLSEHHSMRPSKVRRIEVTVPSSLVGPLTSADPQDCSSAQMSLPFGVSLAFVKASRTSAKSLRVTDYEDSLGDPEVRRLARLVICRPLGEMPRQDGLQSPGLVVGTDRPNAEFAEPVSPHPEVSLRNGTWESQEPWFVEAAQGLMESAEYSRFLKQLRILESSRARDLTRTMVCRQGVSVDRPSRRSQWPQVSEAKSDLSQVRPGPRRRS